MIHHDYKVDYKHYRIKIAAPSASDGFIDNKDAFLWGSTDEGYPTTTAGGLGKSKGFLRWKEVIAKLQDHATPQIHSMDAVGATPDTDATSFEFTAVYVKYGDIYEPNDEATNEEDKIVYGIDAIKLQIAKALMMDREINTLVYDPENEGYSIQTKIIPVGPLVSSLTEGIGQVTVEEIPNT